MDEQRMDALARLFAAGFPRRLVVSGLIAGIVTPLFAHTGNVGAATCKKFGKPCDRNRDCCAHAHCPGNKCRCKSGFTDCDGKCFKLENDEKHCGRCNNRCRSGERCCDGDCRKLKTDRDNCGACGERCGADQDCVAGTCVAADFCPAGADSCAGSGDITCNNDNCVCMQSIEAETKCAHAIPGAICGSCATSADCVTQYGSDSFCAATGSTFCCEPGLVNQCMRVCVPSSSAAAT